jgi:uncharacterized membrane protein
MITSNNRIAGQSVERLAALSDGIFGVAMTLLAIDHRVPAIELIHHEHDLRHELFGLLPEVLVYLMSFLTLGILTRQKKSWVDTGSGSLLALYDPTGNQLLSPEVVRN